MNLTLTNFSLKRPWLIVALTVIAVIFFGSQFPQVKFDNDPENMLAADEYVRVFHDQVKEKYNLYDFVIVGIVNEEHSDGIFNVDTLGRIHRLTNELLHLRQGDDGLPMIDLPGAARRIDLTPQSAWQRILNKAFNHDPNRLFDAQGRSVIIGRELIAPSVVDNIKQADLGALKLEYLMERPPTSRAEALTIRDDAMNNPLYSGTLVAEDEKAICLYIPITEKTYSYNVAALVRALTADWPENDRVLITGLPVAEDTFGIEMLVQMATSAPLAGLMIFLLLLLFFRKLLLVIAPMLVAVVSVVCTMGLLIGLGYDVHIMSSMIAIFLMPIAVADAVHILSEFFDLYPRFGNKKETVRHVIGHLFRPMLFTSLTTMAGFASLATTPIPPVQVFGLHVAFGVAVAWLLSMTLIPAYIMVAVPESRLQSLVPREGAGAVASGPMSRGLVWLGRFSCQQWKLIIVMTLAILAVSAYGINRIQVNDNPVKWFSPEHQIRVADQVLNKHFGGTYTAYLTFSAVRPDQCSCEEKTGLLAVAVKERFGTIFPEATEEFLAVLSQLRSRYTTAAGSNSQEVFVELVNAAKRIDGGATTSWNALADEINYLGSTGLTFDTLRQQLRGSAGVGDAELKILFAQLDHYRTLQGEPLRNQALRIADGFANLSFTDFVFEMEAELTAPLFKQPELLRYIEKIQQHLLTDEMVGKTTSAVDALKKAAFEISYVAPPEGATPQEQAAFAMTNRRHFAVPDSAAAVGQVFVQLEGMKKKDSLFHLVTRDYSEANLWVQLTSGDNQDMEKVVRDVEQFVAANPPPVDLHIAWAGLTYLNVVWQDKMVTGMMWSLGSSFIVVLVMMMLLFRSPLYGLLSMLPLSVTIALIYGVIGLIGKDYDMPVAILSALTLGMSVDFAIHFLQRARDLQRELGSWQAASTHMFKEPAMAISRNAIVISVGFTPLLLAPLVPYKTVGFFLAAIMAVSWLGTLFLLPALMTPLRRKLFKNEPDA